MPRVKLLILLIVSLTALCIGFADLSSTNADQARQESDMRLNMGERSLRTIETFNGRMRVEALTQAVTHQDPALQSAIEGMLRFGLDTDAARTVLQKLRPPLTDAMERLMGVPFDAGDLILIQTDKGLLWEEPAEEGRARAGGPSRHIIAPAQIAASEFGSLEDISTVDQRYTGRYVQLNGRLYHMNAISRTVTVKAQEEETSEGTETRQKFFAAAAKQLTDESMKVLAGKAGVEATVVVGGLIRASSLDDEGQREKLKNVQMRNEGVNLDRFPSLAPLPLRFPIQLSGRAHTHQARLVELAGTDRPDSPSGSGSFVLTTSTDGLMILAAQQRSFVIGLLIFIAVGAFFVFWVGTGLEGSARARTDNEPRLRHTPVAGQHMPVNLPQSKKAKGETDARPGIAASGLAPKTAVPQPAALTPAPTPLPIMDAPLSIPEAAKLSPDGFDFGDSPLAGELSPLPDSAPDGAQDAPDMDAAVPAMPDDSDDAVPPAPAELDGEAAAELSPAFPMDSLDGAVTPGAQEAEPEPGLEGVLFDESAVVPEEDAFDLPQPSEPMEEMPETPAEGDIFEGMEEEAAALLDSLLPDDSFESQPMAGADQDYGSGLETGDKTRQINLAALSELQAASAGLDADVPAGNAITGDPDEAHFNETYENFVALRIQCGEEGTPDYGQFMDKLRRNRDQVMEKYACAGVRFQAYIKDGKAALKATPVR